MFWFTGEGTADGPFRFDIEAQWRVDVCLEAFGEIVETGVVGDGAGCEVAGEIGYFV